jgi:hypothetical protein
MFDLGGGPHIECARCGKFRVSDFAQGLLSTWTAEQKANLSGWIRENQDCLLGQEDLERLRRLRTPPVGEKAEKLLSYISRRHPKPGEKIAMELTFSVAQFEDSSDDRPKSSIKTSDLMGVSWSRDEYELQFLIDEYLISERSFLDKTAEDYLRITPKGWVYLDSLRQGNIRSSVGFIAMWFNESMNDAWVAIDNGIRAAGYEPLRIDQKQHNNKIDDEIIAAIRRSKFLVADVTKQRGGVYFEAGFAKGLGLGVVWLCRKDEIDEVHFDTRQYSHIVWEADKLAGLSKALKDRIEATLGRGPLIEKAVT